nr:MAG TPA: hypothetical protein [Caudoviricetes sp.]
MGAPPLRPQVFTWVCFCRSGMVVYCFPPSPLVPRDSYGIPRFSIAIKAFLGMSLECKRGFKERM